MIEEERARGMGPGGGPAGAYVARRLYRKPVVEGVYRLDDGTLLVGVTLTDVPPGLGTLQEGLAQYRLTGHD